MSPTLPTWIIMPVMAGPDLTEAALSDCLNQSVPTRVLLIGQGIHGEWRSRLMRIAEDDPRLLCWWHDPPLPSLSASWNAALDFVWSTGATEALVVNNDVRLHSQTVEVLTCARTRTEALFVSAVGVVEDQFDPSVNYQGYVGKQPAESGEDQILAIPSERTISLMARGGPDFSCFLISQTGHLKYHFDEGFIPAFCEDLDMHRRYMLGGDGDRIFSINLPFWHVGHGSQTLKSMTPEARAAHERKIGIARQHYQQKWGGPVNAERYTIQFETQSDQDGVTTPELQQRLQEAAGLAKELDDAPFF